MVQLHESLSSSGSVASANLESTSVVPTFSTPRMQVNASRWALGLPVSCKVEARPHPAIIAVGGGKGGVGKSLVSANLSARLALAGRKVLAVDFDLGGANLHTYFGCSNPKLNIADILLNEHTTLMEAAQASPIQGLSFVAGGREDIWGGTEAFGVEALNRFYQKLLNLKTESGTDVVILDLGAGTNPLTIDLFTMANLGAVTVLPEPTSIENAYLFLKTVVLKLVQNCGHRLGEAKKAEELRQLFVQQDKVHGVKASYADKLKIFTKQHPEFGRYIQQTLQGRVVGFTVNQTRSQADVDIGKSMQLIGERYFGLETRFCGYLNHDEAAWKSLRNRRLMLVDFPQAVITKRFGDLARSALLALGF